MQSLKVYANRKRKYDLLIKKQKKYMNNLIISKVIIVILGGISLISLYSLKNSYFFMIIAIVTIILLFFLDSLYKNVENKNKYTIILHDINKNSIERLNGRWNLFDDTGEEFIDENHNYSYDLDIFGKNSLFQWINTSNSYMGRQKLKNVLTEIPKDKQDIYDRQAAVEELAEKIYFRQRLETEGKKIPNSRQDPNELFLWMKQRNKRIIEKQVIFVICILSTVTTILTITLFTRIVAFLFSFLLDIPIFVPKIFYSVPYYIPVLLIVIQLIILMIKKEDRMNNLIIAERYNNSVSTYKNMLRYIEKHRFRSKYIINLCRELCNADGESSSKQISKFSRICECIASRRNMVYLILNPILMMDYHLNISLEVWKKNSGANFENYLNVIAELEGLCSLAVIRYDNPCWSMPKIEDKKTRIIAKNIGHPLLGEKRVCNSIKLEEPHEVILITGSNMSGKSTFMRTIGINIILAYAGAPVCADKFNCPIIGLYTCMKISDNLKEGISSFYAEILKIRKIVETSKEGKPILFLLDEIFKGTNSKDRHTGAKVLIKQLSKKGNIGFVSTHDIELGEMEKESDSRVKNYHFSEYYVDNKICFDYKLKTGVSNTRNAVYLMKLAGIEIENK